MAVTPPAPATSRFVAATVAALLVVASAAFDRIPAARAERLDLRHVELDVPGPPSKVIPADLDGDGLRDLVVVVAYTEIDQITEERVEDLIQMTTVIPAAFDRRELRVYLATPSGGYEPAGPPLELPRSVLHLEPGPPGLGIVALTDHGLSALRFSPEPDGASPTLEPVLDDPPILARTRSFYASLELVHDLNGDGIVDILFPTHEGLAVYLADGRGLGPELSDRIELPVEPGSPGSATTAGYSLPDVRDVNGDAIADLVFSSGFAFGSAERVDVLLGSSEGVFRPLRETAGDCHDRRSDLRLAVEGPDAYPWPRNLAAFVDLDGDGRAEAVLATERPRGDSFRKEMKDAKKPIQHYAFHRLDDGLEIELEPYFSMEIVGHTMNSEEIDEDLPFHIRQFQDLDGDGLEDLVTLTLDFSVFQIVRVLVTKSIAIGVDFHVYCQRDDATFEEIPGLDLSEKLKFDLDNLELGRFAQFAGDFDGDGNQDFVHLGRGKVLTVHRGQSGCRYPKNPDLSIALEEEPASLDLVRIEDLDGDGRADLRVTRLLEADDPDETAPVRLDLYLSGGDP